MAEEQGPEVPSAPPTKVPTAFGFKVTLAPGGSETVTFRGDQDVLLSGISGRADGPAIVETQVTDTPPAGTPVLSIPGGTFTEYLEREFPTHLAAAAGEELAQWTEKNRVLTEAARAGDDEAFFELLARDPRQLASELTLGRVVTWRTEIEDYNRYFRFRVFADSSGCSCGEATVERLVGQGFPRVESRLKPVQVLEQGRPHEAAHVDPIPLLAAGLRRRFRARRRVR